MSGVVPVVTVLRTGGDFTAGHVAGVRRMVNQHLDIQGAGRTRFYCLTDDGSIPQPWRVPLAHPWVGWWAKMEMFRPDFLPGQPFLYMDLDTVLVGEAGMLVADTSTSVVLRDLYRGERNRNALQSSLMLLLPEDRALVWAEWLKNTKQWMRLRGDQNVLERLLRGRVRFFQDVYPQLVVGYKSHVNTRPGKVPPPGARVVVFHGNPRPWACKQPWAEEPFRVVFKTQGAYAHDDA